TVRVGNTTIDFIDVQDTAIEIHEAITIAALTELQDAQSGSSAIHVPRADPTSFRNIGETDLIGNVSAVLIERTVTAGTNGKVAAPDFVDNAIGDIHHTHTTSAADGDPVSHRDRTTTEIVGTVTATALPDPCFVI